MIIGEAGGPGREMKQLIFAVLVLGLCAITLPADAKKRIRYNMKEKVLYGDKTVEKDAFQNRGPASTTSKAKAKVPDILKETNSPRYLHGRDQVVDCKISNVGTSYRGEQCSTAFFKF